MSTESQQSPSPEQLEKLAGQWERILNELPDDQLVTVARRARELDTGEDEEDRLPAAGPKTPEELHQHFKDTYGIVIPTVAVCPGHTDVFTVVKKIVFYEVSRYLVIASRGGGKTSLMAWIHDYSANQYPGYAGLTVGASLQQGERMYEHLLPFVVEGGVIGGKELSHILRSIEKKTIWKIGSIVEIVAATIANVNGPRVPRLHRDEIEVMWNEKADVYKQAGNIPAGRRDKNGVYMPAQIIDTSTMKWAHGIVSQQKEEYENALTEGKRPSRDVDIFCLFEVAEEVPNCRQAPQDEREARLRELGKDPCSLCDCNTYEKGTWDDDDETPRTLESVCNGRFFRSRGFKPRDDVLTLFLENPRREWEAEQECSRPSGEGVYIESFSRNRHGLKRWVPDPIYGMIYMGVDWGGTDAHSIGWYQELDHPVEAELYNGNMHVLPAGSLIRFAEVFRRLIGNTAVGKLAIKKEDYWRSIWPGWRVQERYPDSANAAGIMDWRDELGLITVSRIAKNFDEEVKMVRNEVDDRKFYMVIEECPMGTKAIEAWREQNGHEVHDWASHPMAEVRYVIHNRHVVRRKYVQASTQPADQVARGAGTDDLPEPAVELQKRRQPVKTNKQLVGVAGAEDSPLRSGSRTMGSPGGAHFGRTD